MKDTRLDEYARLLVELGVAVKEGQILMVEAPVEAAELVQAVTKAAFKRKAKDVVVFYTDPYKDHERLLHVNPESLGTVLDWEKESRLHYLKQGACSLLIESAYPYLFADCTPEASDAYRKFTNDLRNNIRRYIATDHIQWCIAAWANPLWAKTLFPNDDEATAITKLKDKMYDICRVREGEDVMANWKKFGEERHKHAAFMDGLHLDSLHYTNGLGTDLVVGLNPNASWGGDRKEMPYCPNIPTEEICTSPDYTRVNGIVYASKPLSLGGAIIEDFGFEFKDGKVTRVFAKKGQEMLEKLIATDEGACYLGECALVADNTPISQSGLLFYTTLYDENASCHLALGRGFPGCIKGIDPLNKDEVKAAHVNDSAIHIDFMFGTADMEIVGTDQDGKQHQIFHNGCFVD